MVTTKKQTRIVSSKKTMRTTKKVTPKKAVKTRATNIRRSASVKKSPPRNSRAAIKKSVSHSLTHAVDVKKITSISRIAVLFIIIAGLLAIFAFMFARKTEAPIDENRIKQGVPAGPSQAQGGKQLGIRLKYPAKLELKKTNDPQNNVRFMLVAPESDGKKIAMRGKVFENVPTDKFPYQDIQRFVEIQQKSIGMITAENSTKWYCLENAASKKCLAQRNSDVFELEYPIDQENPMLPEEFNGVVAGTQL